MRNAILYAGTIGAVVQTFYLAQRAAQHGEPTIERKNDTIAEKIATNAYQLYRDR